jgi:hypothetical protein
MYSSPSYHWLGRREVLLLWVFDDNILSGSGILTLVVTALSRLSRGSCFVDVIVRFPPLWSRRKKSR